MALMTQPVPALFVPTRCLKRRYELLGDAGPIGSVGERRQFSPAREPSAEPLASLGAPAQVQVPMPTVQPIQVSN